jgi:hypothetical protein
LSNENLRTDTFFNVLIQNSPDRFLSIEHLLKCNKLIKMGADWQKILKAVSLSPYLELSSDNLSVRRMEDSQIPNLQDLGDLAPCKIRKVEQAIVIIKETEIPETELTIITTPEQLSQLQPEFINRPIFHALIFIFESQVQ